jgi:hypothetical protein
MAESKQLACLPPAARRGGSLFATAWSGAKLAARRKSDDNIERVMTDRVSGTVAAELLALLERVAALGPLPRVRALHLPPPAADGSREGEFCVVAPTPPRRRGCRRWTWHGASSMRPARGGRWASPPSMH